MLEPGYRVFYLLTQQFLRRGFTVDSDIVKVVKQFCIEVEQGRLTEAQFIVAIRSTLVAYAVS